MYRLGASYMDSSVPRDTDIDLRNSFLSPTTPIVRRPSGSDDAIGGSIYDPSYYSSLFEDNRDVGLIIEGGQNHGNSAGNSVSSAETTCLNPSTVRPFHSKDGEKDVRKSQVV